MYYVEQRGDASIVHVDSELDIVSSPQLMATLERVEANSDRRVIVSLEKCSYCDSTGLSALITARKHLGTRLLTVVPTANKAVHRIFEITGLVHYLSLCESIEVALAELAA